MDFKWACIVLIALCVSAFGCISWCAHSEYECKIAALQAGKTTAEIKEICR